MRAVERVGDRRGDAEGVVHWQGPSADPLGEGLAFEQLEDQEVDRRFAGSGALSSAIVERADIRMIQLRDGTRFPLEALLEFAIRRQAGGQDLDRDGASEARIARLVDLAHPPGAEGSDD